jgi:hypothetical protein
MRTLCLYATRVNSTHHMESSRSELRVRVSIGFDLSGIDWLTPGRSMKLGRCLFLFNPPDGDPCDFWIVFGNLRPHESAYVAAENTLLAIGEPPAKKIYPHRYYMQFAHLVDTHRKSKHPSLLVDAICLPWMVGLSWSRNGYTFGYDYLKSLPPPAKSNHISVVCSNTNKTRGQRRRLAFLKKLKARLGDRIIHYGKGFTPVDDKMETVMPHRFHLVLENSQSPHYWTEKLADAYLGWAFPLYVGCQNLSSYFSPDSFRALDMNDVDGSIKIIEQLLATPLSPAETEVIRIARERVLEDYNPFKRFETWVERFYCNAPPKIITLRSPKAFWPWKSWYRIMT